MPHLFLDEQSHDSQRRALLGTLGSDGLAHLLDGGRIDPVRGRRVAQLPSGPTAGARDAIASDLVDVDDHLTTPEEFLAAEDARRARRAGESEEGGTYDGLVEVAAGKKRVRGRSGNDKGPKARRTGGRGELVGPTKLAHENWDDLRGGKVRPVVVGARVTIESKDTLDADQTVSNGELMESVAIVMRKTGKSKAEVQAAIERLAETGMADPDIVDALPAASSKVIDAGEGVVRKLGHAMDVDR